MKPILLGSPVTLRTVILSLIMGAVALSLFPSSALAQAKPSAAPAQARQGITKFDHLKTGFPLSGAHVTVTCETCHMGGILKGTPTTCAGCHSIGSRVGATPKSVNHVQTSNSCETCHSSATSFQVATFKHTGITSGCASCHNGTTAPGKSANHVQTSASCETCHKSATSFLGASFSHTGITTGCASCHNGTAAPGKPGDHIPTTIVGPLDCNTCHTSTSAWSSERMNHNAAQTGCVACHLSGTAYSGRMEKMNHQGASAAKDCSSSLCHKPLGRTGSAYVSWN